MASQQEDQPSTGAQQPNTPPPSLKNYITSDMVATTLFNMRLITILCTVIYFMATIGSFANIGGKQPYTELPLFFGTTKNDLILQSLFSVGFAASCYTNTLLTSFFTFCIRLYQRKTQQGISLLSKDMYILASTEDSGHYMLYTFFYLNQMPMSIYLLPPFLYALMFTVTYTNGLIPFLPGSMQRVLSRLNDWIAQKQQDMRRYIAYAEIFIMFVVITNVLSGYMFFLAPLLHYNFLKWRYQSLRNPAVRVAFADLRMAMEYLARHPKCPPFVSTILNKTVSVVSSLAPSQHMRREA